MVNLNRSLLLGVSSLSAGIILLSEVFYWLVMPKLWPKRHIQRGGAESGDKPRDVHKVVFFPDSGITCPRSQGDASACTDSKCRYLHFKTSLQYFVDLLSSATRTLDVCVFIITNYDLGNAIIRLHQKGVVVRIIADRSQETAPGEQLGRFRAEGIAVRLSPKSSALMHHKFVVIDKSILVNGSFNWTRQAVFLNHENLLVTTDEKLLQPFIEEFTRLWQLFDPEKKSNSLKWR